MSIDSSETMSTSLQPEYLYRPKEFWDENVEQLIIRRKELRKKRRYRYNEIHKVIVTIDTYT